MKPLRLLAGWLCVAIGCALVVLLGLGAFDPVDAPASLGPVLVAMLPSVTIGLALFAVGVWLINTGKPRR
jgi:hypothetical protein